MIAEIIQLDIRMSFYNQFILSEMLGVYLFQIFMIYAVLSRSDLEISSEPPLLSTAFTRFLAGLIMQIKMSKELKEGLSKMKYSLNHYWKFHSPIMAFFAGFCQTSMVMLVVLLNFYSILLEDNPIDIVMNFLALVIIAEIDDYFFEAHGKIRCKQMVQEQDETFASLYEIQTTTSIDAGPWEDLPGLNDFEPAEDAKWYKKVVGKEFE